MMRKYKGNPKVRSNGSRREVFDFHDFNNVSNGSLRLPILK